MWRSKWKQIEWLAIWCRSACVQGRKREAMLQVGLLLGAQAEAELRRSRAGLQTGWRAAAERGVTVRAEDRRATHHRAPPNRWRFLDRPPPEPWRWREQRRLFPTVLLARRKQIHIQVGGRSSEGQEVKGSRNVLPYFLVRPGLNSLFVCCRNWHWDEPSCGYEVCVVMYHQPSAPPGLGGLYMFQWNDDNCETKNNFICKYTAGTADAEFQHFHVEHSWTPLTLIHFPHRVTGPFPVSQLLSNK